MSFVGDMLSGSKGAGFQGTGVDQTQINTAYGQTQQGIAQQQAFVDALKGQNGLENQTSVFNQQQQLSDQLQGVANGTGPNPALAQLNQTTGNNVANQAALMAGQRGSNANIGMIARQAAQQGAATQQQAVGQGATLGAQQQLAGMQQLQNQQTSMGNMANQQVGQRQAGLSALNQASGNQQANLLGMQANINNANAGIAKGNQGSQGNILGSMTGAIGSAGNLFGGSKPTGLNPDGTIPTMGSGISDGTGAGSTFVDGVGGSGMGAAGDAAGYIAAARGGMVPKRMAEGGDVESDPLMQPVAQQEVASPVAPVSQPTNGPQSNIGKLLSEQSKDPAPAAAPAASGGAGNMMGGAMAGLSSVGGGAMGKATGMFSNLGNEIAGHPDDDSFGGHLSNSLGGGTGADFFGNVMSMYTSPSKITGFLGNDVAKGTGIQDTQSYGDKLKLAEGGNVPALVSPGEQYLKPKDVEKVVKQKADPLSVGERIPGKAKVAGNSYANDTVPKTLESGGIVIPKSVMEAKNPHWEAMKFVHATMAKNGRALPKKGSK